MVGLVCFWLGAGARAVVHPAQRVGGWADGKQRAVGWFWVLV